MFLKNMKSILIITILFVMSLGSFVLYADCDMITMLSRDGYYLSGNNSTYDLFNFIRVRSNNSLAKKNDDGHGSDFFMFGRTSNRVLFDFATDGSVFAVSISEDGQYCTFGGKAVHANILGNGGFLYGIKSNLEDRTYTFPSQFTIPDCGWKWLSFDILWPEEDDNVAMNFLAPISGIDELDYAQFKPHGDNSSPEIISFQTIPTQNLDHPFISPYGYKFKTLTECDFTVTGQRWETNSMELYGNNQENWIGYFLEETQHIYDAFADHLDNTTGIKAQHWAIKKENGSWPDVPYTISPGDMVIAYFETDEPAFYWCLGDAQERYTVPASQDFTYEEEADYIPVFIELDPDDMPSEIGAYVDGECKGATVVQDESAQICAYILDNQGQNLEFEFSYGSRSVNKLVKKYSIVEPEISKIEKGSIQIDNSRDCYYVSFKGNQNDTPAPVEIKITNFPNPFNPETTLFFSLSTEQEIELTVYNLKGQKVKQLAKGQFPSGKNSVVWNGTDDNGKQVGSGLYLSKLTTSEKTVSKKMLLLK